MGRANVLYHHRVATRPAVTRRRFLAACGALAPVLAACAGWPDRVPLPAALRAATPTPTEPRRVRVARPSLASAAADDRLRPLFARLEAERHMRFEVVPLDVGSSVQEQSARYAAALASLPPDQMPDLVFCSVNEVGDLGRQNLLLDLGPLLRNEAWFSPDAFYGNVLRAGEVRGKQVALPLGASVEMLLRNDRVFEERGVAPPQPGWTWDDFLATATALTGPGRWGCHVSPFAPSLQTLAWQHGAEMVTPDGSRVVLDEPGTLRALEFLADLVHTHKVAPPLDARTIETYQQFNHGWNALRGGQAAMIAAWAGGYVWWRSASTVVATEMPRAEHRVVAGAIDPAVAVPRNAPDVDLALAALRALSEDGATAFFLPVRRDVADLRRVEPVLMDTEAAALRDTLDIARFLPGDYPRTALLLYTEVVLPVLTGDKPPAQALHDAQPLLDAEVARSE